MQFNEYETLYQIARRDLGRSLKHVSAQEFYPWLLNESRRSSDPDSVRYQIRSVQELDWYNERQPFYKVWPAVIPPLTKTSLDITLTNLQLKDFVAAIYLPVPQGSMLVVTASDPLLTVTIQVGNNGEAATIALDHPTKPIEQQVAEHPQGTMMLRLAVAILMLNNDPEIVEPLVLSKDRLKPHDAKHVEKARRRGLYGWDVGRQIEVIPHIRRPHFGIRWTGNGRSVPRLVPIKGSVIHKAAITTVPTGHLDHDNSPM